MSAAADLDIHERCVRMSAAAPPAWRDHVVAYLAWLDARGLSEQTKELRIYQITRAAEWLHGRDPMTLKSDDLMLCLNRGDWAPATKSAMLAGIKTFYRWAVDGGRIDTSPAARIPRVKVPAPRPQPVTDDDYDRAIAAATTLEQRVMLRLAGIVGLRRAEVAAIHRGHIVETPTGYVLDVTGKGGKHRAVPLPGSLAADLLTLTAGGTGYAFPAPGRDRHVTPHWVGTVISGLLPDGVTMHKLRHRALTRAYNATKDIVLTAQLAGHSSVATTQAYYVAPDQAALRSMIEGMGE